MEHVDRIVRMLGGKKTLGEQPTSDVELVEVVRRGLPYRSLESVLDALELSVEEMMSSLNFSKTTFYRRKREGSRSRLQVEESEKIVRLASIASLAEDVFGGGEKAFRWLRKPNRALGGQRPLDLLDTDIGTQAVENELGRIEYSIVS